jgi:hypothetical protein
MTTEAPPTINDIDDLDCDICKKPLKGFKGYKAGLTRPVNPNDPLSLHEYYIAIHVDCYKVPQ